MKRIVVQYGEVKAIAKIANCTFEMVSHALAYRKNSLLARKIRKIAIERGGQEVEFQPIQKQEL